MNRIDHSSFFDDQNGSVSIFLINVLPSLHDFHHPPRLVKQVLLRSLPRGSPLPEWKDRQIDVMQPLQLTQQYHQFGLIRFAPDIKKLFRLGSERAFTSMSINVDRYTSYFPAHLLEVDG